MILDKTVVSVCGSNVVVKTPYGARSFVLSSGTMLFIITGACCWLLLVVNK